MACCVHNHDCQYLSSMFWNKDGIPDYMWTKEGRFAYEIFLQYRLNNTHVCILIIKKIDHHCWPGYKMYSCWNKLAAFECTLLSNCWEQLFDIESILICTIYFENLSCNLTKFPWCCIHMKLGYWHFPSVVILYHCWRKRSHVSWYDWSHVDDIKCHWQFL